MATDAEPLSHVWVRYIIAPVNAFRNEQTGEPHLEYDRAAIVELLNDPDVRVGCLTCHIPLDEGWGKPCEPQINMAQFEEAGDDQPLT